MDKSEKKCQKRRMMGYFSNGSEGMDYEVEYCNRCYWGDKPCMGEGEEPKHSNNI